MKKNYYLNKFRLDKKLAIVVGGLGLIGREIINSFLDAGAKVIVLDKLSNKIKNKKNIFFYNYDCKNYVSFEKDLKKIQKKFGIPQILINASYPATKDWPNNSFEKIKFESYKKNIDIHLNSYVIMAKVFADSLKEHKKSGSIVQLSSIYGLVAQNMNLYEGTKANNNMTYPVIKSGINMFSKQLASYYGKYNIRVNNLCPGGIIGNFKGTSNSFDKNFIKKYKQQTTLKRFCNSEDVACAALFLASDASSYITGTDIVVDGGYTIT